jgi:hypothetical protein
MSVRVAELETQIRRLVAQRDAQPADTLYALDHQRRIDALSVELIAWRLDGARMQQAEDAIRAAGRRQRHAHTGRRRWPVVAGTGGVLGGMATAGHIAADAGGVPLLGGALLTLAAAALALTAVDRVRDAREAAAAETDMDTAQQHYAAVVARHARAIAPLRPLAIHNTNTQEEPCSSTPPPSSPANSHPTVTAPAPRSGADAAATTGHPRTASPLSAVPSPTVAA